MQSFCNCIYNSDLKLYLEVSINLFDLIFQLQWKNSTKKPWESLPLWNIDQVLYNVSS